MTKHKNIHIEFRFWLFIGNEKLLGKGRIELLERINNTGSILNAAKEMKMSYRQAWQMVEEMNERASAPLVEKKLGGKSGGGANVTASGKKAIKLFHALEKELETFIRTKSKNINI